MATEKRGEYHKRGFRKTIAECFRWSKEEMDVVTRAAAACGATRSDFVRKAAVTRAATEFCGTPIGEEARAILKEEYHEKAE